MGTHRYLILSSTVAHVAHAAPAALVPCPASQRPDLLRPNVMSVFTALNNMNVGVCNCVTAAELELHFPEFLSYTVSGWSWSKEKFTQDVEEEVKLQPLLS